MQQETTVGGGAVVNPAPASFINKALLTAIVWLLLGSESRPKELRHRPYGLQDLKYLSAGLL